MSVARIDSLTRGLCEIRAAASNVDDREWSAAAELDRVLQDQAPHVSAIYELTVYDQSLKGTVTMACHEWDAIYRQAKNFTSPTNLQEAGLVVAARLVTRIDALLASIQAHEDEGKLSYPSTRLAP